MQSGTRKIINLDTIGKVVTACGTRKAACNFNGKGVLRISKSQQIPSSGIVTSDVASVDTQAEFTSYDSGVGTWSSEMDLTKKKTGKVGGLSEHKESTSSVQAIEHRANVRKSMENLMASFSNQNELSSVTQQLEAIQETQNSILIELKKDIEFLQAENHEMRRRNDRLVHHNKHLLEVLQDITLELEELRSSGIDTVSNAQSEEDSSFKRDRMSFDQSDLSTLKYLKEEDLSAISNSDLMRSKSYEGLDEFDLRNKAEDDFRAWAKNELVKRKCNKDKSGATTKYPAAMKGVDRPARGREKKSRIGNVDNYESYSKPADRGRSEPPEYRIGESEYRRSHSKSPNRSVKMGCLEYQADGVPIVNETLYAETCYSKAPGVGTKSRSNKSRTKKSSKSSNSKRSKGAGSGCWPFKKRSKRHSYIDPYPDMFPQYDGP